MTRHIISICCLTFLILGCTPKNSKQKNILKIGVRSGPTTLNPYGSQDVTSGAVRVNLFDSLVERNESGQICPALATKWEHISPTNIQFELRSNVMFHNGYHLTVEDVKYSFELASVSPEMEHIITSIKKVKIIDTNSFQIILKEPFAPLLSILSIVNIVNQKTIETDKRNIDRDPIGTGPYQLIEWNDGQNIILERNTNYWRELAHIPKIDMMIAPEGSARAIALETGEIDIAYDIYPIDAERIEVNKDLTLISKVTPALEYLGINLNGPGANPIWQDKRVREALALSVDIQGIINSVYFGRAIIPNSFLPPDVFGYYDGLPIRQQNIEKAKELIKEAGITKEDTITLYGPEGIRAKTLEIIQANLREIGLYANIRILEWGAFLETTSRGMADVFIIAWVTDTRDASSIYRLLHSNATNGGGNRMFYSNPIVDQKLDIAQSELNIEKRKLLYQEIQEILYEDIPVVPIFYYVDLVGIAKNINGFILDDRVQHRLRTVHFE